MPETAEQYTKRILGNLEGRKPLDILAATPRRIARLIAGVPKRKLARRPAKDASLDAFRATRVRTLHLLRNLPRKSWESYGLHSERGKETVTRTVEMLAGHDINHLKQIQERVAK